MCAQRSSENIIFGGRTSQPPANRHLFAAHFSCCILVVSSCVSGMFFLIVNTILNCIYIVFEGHGAHCFSSASQRLVLKHTVRPCVAAQGLTGWSQLTPQCVGETARLFSYTEAPLWKAKNLVATNLRAFWIKLGRVSYTTFFFLWRLEQKHTCKSVSQLVRIIARTCGFFPPMP